MCLSRALFNTYSISDLALACSAPKLESRVKAANMRPKQALTPNARRLFPSTRSLFAPAFLRHTR